MKKIISHLLLAGLLIAPVSQAHADASDVLKLGSAAVVGFAAGVFGLYYYLKKCADQNPEQQTKIKTEYVHSPEQVKADQLRSALKHKVGTAQLIVPNPTDHSAIIALFKELGFRVANTYDPDATKLLFEKQPVSLPNHHTDDSRYSGLFSN